MDQNSRLIEIMAELLAEVHDMKVQMIDLQKGMFELQGKTHAEMIELRKQQTKTNAGVAEIRLSFMSLAEKIEENYGHEQRIKALEEAVFRRAS